uniref:Bacteriophage/plasmid primase P4 C-terminal domain-containing protein n=1 Tax=viral metagenome TaxID=1070528 RepID=A0A6C0CAE0_9ZZZZ
MSYVCVSKKNKIWYKFSDHRWHKIVPSKKITEYKYDPKFIDSLDNDKNLVAFENGVYDLIKGFRNGHPNDYISKSIGYNYELSQCQDKDYFGKEQIKILAQVCCSSNDNILIFKDLCKDQKNVLISMLQTVLGDYVQLITSNDDEIDKNVKVYLIDNFELDDDEIDEYLLRIYESNTFGTPVILCNESPVTNFKDDWFWDRVLVVANPYTVKMNPCPPMIEKTIIYKFLQQNVDFEIPSDIIRATEDYYAFCESYQIIEMNGKIVNIPKMIKETNLYSILRSGGALTNVILHNVDLRGINMQNISIYNCDFTGSNFRGCKFNGARIERTIMQEVDFRLVDLTSCHIRHVDFRGAKFDDVRLIKCTIKKSNFTDVNMDNIDSDSCTSYEKCAGV